MANIKTNPVAYFEVPVIDMQRAVRFYQALFDFRFEKEELDGYDMAFFPFYSTEPGITGALVKGDVYRPSKNGVILYFNTDHIDNTLNKAILLNAKILYPKTINEEYGFIIAEIEDCEGNRIALRQNTKEN
ncbi:VOC family protein [Chryseobacterium sp. SSA4.19]|uniref:VOC family protein n=1 Tax=Chryseobacterium sp. SSA4.19 TaxID=2919915 RepID=UPI001F4D58E7|nr:VOC family protein [Chryseobacterium sp. SSA4.19]MCJ8152634.1 VOC family protein [Chryseobacterium sp. SSA4.19]